MPFKKYLKKATLTTPFQSWMVGVGILGVVGVLDFVTGYEFPFFLFYFPALVIVSWNGRWFSVLIMSFFCTLVWFLADIAGGHPYSSGLIHYSTSATWFFSFLSVSLLVLQLRRVFNDEEALNIDLRRALDEVQELRGLLRICAGCKKIRDDDGSWHEVEIYVTSRTKVEFSHSICPDCLKKLYGDLMLDDEEERKEDDEGEEQKG